MASDRVNLGPRTVQARGVTLGPAQIPPARRLLVSVLDAAQHLDPTVVLTLALETSHDGGATWIFDTSTTRPGGVVLGEDGQVETTMRLALDLASERGVRRRIRSPVIAEGGAFATSGGFMEASD